MSNHSDPIVQTILFVADQRHPWKLAPITRHAVTYHTPTTVRLVDSMTRHQHQVYCIADDAAWGRALAARAALQTDLNALADGLRALGSYASRLAAAGGTRIAPNPLCPTVISAPDPDTADEGSWFTGRLVPRIERDLEITSHTPKMLHVARDGKPWSTSHQRDHFVCPDDAAWHAIEALIAAAQERARAWEQLLKELGTYQAALADGRYAREEESMAASMPAGALAVATPAGGLSTALQDCARAYVAARERAGVALLEMAQALAKARTLAKHGEWYIFLESIGIGEDQADRLLDIDRLANESPDYADAVRRNFLNPTTAALLARSSTPAVVVGEVLQRSAPTPTRQVEQQIKQARGVDVNPRSAAGNAPAQPTAAPFWQAMSPNHPTAHLWTRTGMNEHHAACGMVAQRAPSGSTETSHCSRCVRATWPQNQAAAEKPKIPELNPITVQTSQGPRIVTPLQSNGVLALHVSVTPGGTTTISHVATGRAIAQFMRSISAERAYAQLIALDWQLTPEGGAGPVLGLAIARIVTQFDDVDHLEGRLTRLRELESAAQPAAAIAAPAPASAQRLSPGDHATAVVLLSSIRACLLTDQLSDAAEHTRQLLALLTSPAHDNAPRDDSPLDPIWRDLSAIEVWAAGGVYLTEELPERLADLVALRTRLERLSDAPDVLDDEYDELSAAISARELEISGWIASEATV